MKQWYKNISIEAAVILRHEQKMALALGIKCPKVRVTPIFVCSNIF